ncbi:MAG TPA: hypothetical protein VGO50_19550 [Pyrinomonadaceae bacterium]|jgi:hypothetical protein|nr:hypothetical protein [Pyrinomonadaceae bacterium]
MEYLRRFFNFWFPNAVWIAWFVLALMGIYFFQTLIHEGSHNFTTIAASGDSPVMAPFPHKNRNDDFLNGVNLTSEKDKTSIREDVSKCDGTIIKKQLHLKGFPGTPQIVDLFIITGLFFLFFFSSVKNPILRFPFIVWYLAAVFDFVYNTGTVAFGGCSGNDWSDVFLRGYLDRGVLIGLTWMFWIIFILSHFVWIYWARWGEERVDGSAFTATDKFGDWDKYKDRSRFWDFRWLALTFGLLSFICFIWASAWLAGEGDPRVRTDTGAFLGFYVLHIILAIICFTIFGLSFYFKKASKI